MIEIKCLFTPLTCDTESRADAKRAGRAVVVSDTNGNDNSKGRRRHNVTQPPGRTIANSARFQRK